MSYASKVCIIVKCDSYLFFDPLIRFKVVIIKLGYYRVMPSEPVEGVVFGRPVEG